MYWARVISTWQIDSFALTNYYCDDSNILFPASKKSYPTTLSLNFHNAKIEFL